MPGRAKQPNTPVPTRTLIWDPTNCRRWVGMTIGGADDHGFTEMVLGLVARSLDEHMLGFGARISVEVRDGVASVTDEGRAVQPRRRSVVKGLETLASGGRFPRDRHALARGATRTGNWFRMHEADLSAINAASDRFEVESHDGASSWAMAFERGTPTVALHRVGPSMATFTRFRFQPARELFGAAKVDIATIKARLQVLALLVPRAQWSFQSKAIRQPEGLTGLVWSSGQIIPGSMLAVTATIDRVRIELAIGLSSTASGRHHGFVNFERAEGTHVAGVLEGVRQAFGGDAADLIPRVCSAVHVGMRELRLSGGWPDYDLRDERAFTAVARLVATELRRESDVRVSWLEVLRHA